MLVQRVCHMHVGKWAKWHPIVSFIVPNCPCRLHTTAEVTRVCWLEKYQLNTKCHGCWACAPKFGNCIKGRPCNVKTIDRGPGIRPIFLPEYDFEKFYCDSRVKLSVLLRVLHFAMFALVLSVANTDVYNFVHWSGHADWGSRPWNSKLQVAKSQSSDEGLHNTYICVIRDVLCEYASAQRKLQLSECIRYFVVCVGLYDFC